MIRLRHLISTLLILALAFQISIAQKDYYGLSKKEIKNLSTIELVKGNKKFPESYMYGMHGDSLILLTDVSSWNEPTFFAKSKISIGGYDELIVSSKAERKRKSMLWGALFGGLSYAVALKSTKTKAYERTVSKTILGQKSNNGQIEGVMAGITGFGFGMIIGQTLAKRKLNLRKQQRKALRELREFSYH